MAKVSELAKRTATDRHMVSIAVGVVLHPARLLVASPCGGVVDTMAPVTEGEQYVMRFSAGEDVGSVAVMLALDSGHRWNFSIVARQGLGASLWTATARERMGEKT